MKLSLPAFVLALFFVFTPASRAQDDESTPIKVTITRYKDNSYTAMKTDPDSHAAESSTYNSGGKLTQTIVFALDDQGRAIGGFVYAPKGDEPKGILLYKTRYQYDEAGRVGEVDYYTTTDQLQSRQIYHYDAAGKFTRSETYDAAGHLVNSNAAVVAIPGSR